MVPGILVGTVAVGRALRAAFLPRSQAPAWERDWEAGASGAVRSQAGAWERVSAPAVSFPSKRLYCLKETLCAKKS